MAFIYKITNKINGKSYIGQTSKSSIEERFNEHWRSRNSKRFALQNALIKYGKENFNLELLEETDNPSEREKFYIEYYNTFKDGYNETRGGEGESRLPYTDKEIIDFYLNSCYYKKECLEHFDICNDTLNNILKRNNIQEKQTKNTSATKRIAKYTKDDIFIQEYDSIREAALELGNVNKESHIIKVCRGERKSAYNFKWKYID